MFVWGNRFNGVTRGTSDAGRNRQSGDHRPIILIKLAKDRTDRNHPIGFIGGTVVPIEAGKRADAERERQAGLIRPGVLLPLRGRGDLIQPRSGRISIVPVRTCGIFEAIRIASLRSLASIR